MPSRCRTCGRELRPQAQFCPECGQPVETGPQEPRRAHPYLLIRAADRPPREVLLDRPTLTIGRSPDNDVVLAHAYVSSRHGQLERRGTEWHYLDLDSTNGSYVNGRRVTQAVLRDGDILRIGDVHGNSVGLTFHTAERPKPEGVHAGAVRVGSTGLKMHTALTIGRDPQAGVHLPAPVVSWEHARLDRTPQGPVLADLNSTNGTFVNGHRLTRPALLREGDVVQIGPFKLVYQEDTLQHYTAAGGMRLDGVHLVREVGKRGQTKRILKDISVSLQPREFVALVGTSGAGKTTLMMALNGFARAEGQVLVNGDDLYRQFDIYRTLIGYVPQDDIIHKELTVASALRYAARLRLPPDTSSQEIEQRIDQVLESVEMVGQKNQVVNSLSGGQRKRVSIAVELLAEPSLFFLDEPTSGLDPGLEKKMMFTLRRLADGGRTVLLVTHATANIVQCDHVCFLSQGRLVYFGPPEEAFDFFGVTSGDFADIYDQLDDADPQVAEQKAQEWEQTFRASSYHQEYVEKRQQELPQARQQAAQAKASRRGPKVNILRQFFVLTRRYMDLVLRDKLLLTVLMAVMPMVGALVLLVAEPNWLVGNTLAEIEGQLAGALKGGDTSTTYAVVGDSQTLLFILALASVLLGLFASVYEIVKEWSVYQRERMVTLRILPYIGSKVVVLGIFAMIQCLLLMLVVALKVDMPWQGVLLPAPLEMYITLVLATVSAILMGLLISAIVPNTNTVIYIVFLALFFQLIFAGVLFDLPGITKRFSSLTLTRWAMEGLGTSANVDHLNGLTRTRFQPDPITEVVSVEVDKPADDWEPVTVVTTTQEIAVPVQPGITQTVPISVPEVTVNEMITVTETVTESVTVDPEPMDIYTEEEFQIRYTRNLGHLIWNWTLLVGFGLFFAVATMFVLRRKDIG